MSKVPDSGFSAIVAGLTQTSQLAKTTTGYAFIGYRLKGFDEFVALMNINGNEQRMDKYTCEQVVKNSKPGSESYEVYKKVLQHWPSAN
jgi:hypothetical protein